jgi:Na+/melibiose symporter-like transporter
MSGAQAAASRPASADEYRVAIVVGTGIFGTTLAQLEVLDLPFRLLLQTRFDASPQQTALFFAAAGAPWFFKPIAGLLSDSVPLFGTRRRHYLILCATLAAVFWLALGPLSHGYALLLMALVTMNAALVVASTVIGGLIAEKSREYGSAQRLVSARGFVEGACVLLAGPLSAWLAGMPFESAVFVGAAIAFSVVPVAFFWLVEPRVARVQRAVLYEGLNELKTVARSRTVWLAGLFLLCISLPQTFPTTLYFHQTTTLKFAVGDIGYLNAASGVGSLLAPALYLLFSRRLAPRRLLAVAVAAGAIGTAIDLFYASYGVALAIHLAGGVLFNVSFLAVMELAVWATPPGAAAMGFALLMSAWNIGGSAGDILGAQIAHGWSLGFFHLVAIYAAFALLPLCAIRFLPRAMFARDL